MNGTLVSNRTRYTLSNFNLVMFTEKQSFWYLSAASWGAASREDVARSQKGMGLN